MLCCAQSLQSCLILCNPMECSPPGFFIHGILQVGTLEWVAMPSSRGSSRIRDRTYISYVSCIGRQIFTTSAAWEALGRSWSRELGSSAPRHWKGPQVPSGLSLCYTSWVLSLSTQCKPTLQHCISIWAYGKEGKGESLWVEVAHFYFHSFYWQEPLTWPLLVQGRHGNSLWLLGWGVLISKRENRNWIRLSELAHSNRS